MTADKLGSGVDHNIRPVLNGPDEIGCAESIVNDQGQAVGVGDFGNGVNVGDITVGVAQRLQIDGLGVGPDGGGDSVQIMGVHKGGGYTILRQRMGQQVVAAAVDGLLGHDVIPRLGQGLDGVGNCRGAGGGGQSRHASLQSRDTLFQHILGGVGQPAIDVSGISQPKAGGCMGRIPKHIGGGLVNGYRPGIGGRVRLLLAHMELQCLKFIAHGKIPLFLK